MALKLFTSNQLDTLAIKLSEDVRRQRNIFSPTVIITQTAGMNQWLIRKIAKQNGIAANIDFLKPGNFIELLYKSLGLKRQGLIPRKSMDWLLFQALSEAEFRKKFPLQFQYFWNEEKQEINEVKKWDLAIQLADLFDQYQVYRYNSIKQWNAGNIQANEKSFNWQVYLWNRIKDIAGDAFPDMTQMHDDILKALDDASLSEKIQNKFPQVAIFGISILTPFHIEILYKLATQIDISFYLLDPSPQSFWYYDQSEKEISKKAITHNVLQGNELLSNWGKVIQNTYKILFQDDALLNVQNDENIVAPERDTLLHKIQNDIYHNRISDIQFSLEDLKDKSIQVTAAYSIQSEVQALYSYLLELVEKQLVPNLKESEILVMTSEIDAYAPFIRSVFEGGPFHFNFSIADESIVIGDSWQNAVLSILDLTENNFLPEIILQLLTASCIQKKTGIYNLELIRSVIQAAQIHWGFQNRKEDDTYLVSWKYGLQKIMYGLCMEGSHQLENKNGQYFYSLHITDSQEDFQQISRFSYFIEILHEHIQKRKQHRKMSEWLAFIQETIDQFIWIENDEIIEQQVQKFIHSWHPFLNFPEFELEQLIPYSVMWKRAKTQLLDINGEYKFLSKGITFCSPLPFRSIPFKVIAFLGLNMEVFPRKEKDVNYNMIKNDYQLGDRNVRENDKHLFLESLLSAQEKLYLSYIGQSIENNTPLPPSIMIDELLDYIQLGLDNYLNNVEKIEVQQYLIERKPLHLYSNKYNHPDSKLSPNYLIQATKKYPIKKQNHTNIEGNREDTIKLNELHKTGISPYELYFKKQLGIYLNEKSQSISDTEIFELDHLSLSILKKQLLVDRLNGNDSNAFILKEYLNGNLPLKNVKEVCIDEMLQSVHQLMENGDLPSNIDLEKRKFNIHLQNGKNLIGELEWVYKNQLYLFQTNDKAIDLKNKVKAYINHLIGSKLGWINTTQMLSNKEIISLKKIDSNTASKQLEEIIEAFEIASTQPVFFEINTKNIDQLTAEDYYDKMENSYSEYFNYLELFPPKAKDWKVFERFRKTFIENIEAVIV